MEAVSHPRVRDILRDSLRAFDSVINDRLGLAIERAELGPKADAKALTLTAAAIMHSLAVRARAGESRKSLDRSRTPGST